MNTLTSKAITELLNCLHKQADEFTNPALKKITVEERDRLIRSKTEYLNLYTAINDLWLPVSKTTGKLLYMLARNSRAKVIVEFGTSVGISTIYLAAALRDNGSGHLITTEFEPSKLIHARKNLTEANLIDLVEIREGDALITLSENLPTQIDLVLLDGAKALYNDVLFLLEKNLSPNALIIADNANYCPDYLEYVRTVENGYLSISLGNDVELTTKLSG